MKKLFNLAALISLIFLFASCQFVLQDPLLTANNTTIIPLEEGLYEEISKSSPPILGQIEITKQKNSSNAFLGKYLHDNTSVELLLEPLDEAKSLYILQQQEIDENKKPVDYPVLTVISIKKGLVKVDSIKFILTLALNTVSSEANNADTSVNNNFKKNKKDFLTLLTKYNLKFNSMNKQKIEDSETNEEFFLEISTLSQLKGFLLELRENEIFVKKETVIFEKIK